MNTSPNIAAAISDNTETRVHLTNGFSGGSFGDSYPCHFTLFHCRSSGVGSDMVHSLGIRGGVYPAFFFPYCAGIGRPSFSHCLMTASVFPALLSTCSFRCTMLMIASRAGPR